MTVGENIRKIRKEKGLTQKKLGELCYPSISESTIRKYELGILKPKIERKIIIAKALNVNPQYLSPELSECNDCIFRSKKLSEYSSDELIREIANRLKKEGVNI
jgi:transcriptional regulator with XRE-family HTH domain